MKLPFLTWLITVTATFVTTLTLFMPTIADFTKATTESIWFMGTIFGAGAIYLWVYSVYLWFSKEGGRT